MTALFDGAYCLVSREYPPHAGGGIGTYAKTFARLLADRGVPVVVVTAHADIRTEDNDSGVTVIRLPLNADDRWTGPHPSVDSAEMTTLWRTLGPHSVFSKQIADLVPELFDRFGVRVIEGCDTGAPLWHLLDNRGQTNWNADVRIITHVHSPSAWIERLNRRLEQSHTMHALQRMEREQTRHSDAVVTPSLGMQSWIAEHWGVRADVVRYPFVPSEPSPASGSDGGVLFVGRLEYRKGIDTLLRAWPSVDTVTKLTLVGRDVIDYRTGASIGQPLLSGLDRLDILGTQPPGSVADLQARASVVVVPSPDDNFPFTCIEAMAAGGVVVAANSGGAAEMIEHGTSGLLFEPYDRNGLAETLTSALGMNESDATAMGAAARERIGSMCDPERVLRARIDHALSEAEPVSSGAPADGGVPLKLRRFAAQTSSTSVPLWRHIARRARNLIRI
ncbi:MAG: glycosyltransferase family 4 protein [Planctomycetota bacterium]